MNDSRASKRQLVKLGLVLLVVGALGATANYAASQLFPLQWGGPNIGGGLLQVLCYAGIVVGVAVMGSGLVMRRR